LSWKREEEIFFQSNENPSNNENNVKESNSDKESVSEWEGKTFEQFKKNLRIIASYECSHRKIFIAFSFYSFNSEHYKTVKLSFKLLCFSKLCRNDDRIGINYLLQSLHVIERNPMMLKRFHNWIKECSAMHIVVLSECNL